MEDGSAMSVVHIRFIQSVTVGESPFILAAGATGDSREGGDMRLCLLPDPSLYLAPAPVTRSPAPALTRLPHLDIHYNRLFHHTQKFRLELRIFLARSPKIKIMWSRLVAGG